MTEPADRIVDRLRAERRRANVFRKGIVTALDKSVTPWVITASDGERSRKMPYINESVEVGDIVHMVDQPDPFAWADVVTAIPGEPFFDFDNDDTSWASNSFFGTASAVYSTPGGFTGNVVKDADDNIRLTVAGEWAMAVSWLVCDSTATPTTLDTVDGYELQVHDETVGGCSVSFMIAPHQFTTGTPDVYEADLVFPARTYEPTARGSQLWWLCNDVRDIQIEVGATEFPTVTAPGPDWTAVYGIFVEHHTGPDGSYTFPAELTELAVPSASMSGVLDRYGDMRTWFERSTEAGVMPTRALDTLDVGGRTYALFSMLTGVFDDVV